MPFFSTSKFGIFLLATIAFLKIEAHKEQAPSGETSSPPPAASIWDLVSYLSANPPKASKAEKLCKNGRLPRAIDTALSPASMGGAKTLDVFVLKRLAFNAELINVIACLVEKDVIEVNQTIDGGAALLVAAVEKKHARLVTSLLMRSARRPPKIIAEAVSNRLFVLEITQKLLMPYRAKKSLSPPAEAIEYAKWIADMVSSLEQHLPAEESKQPANALVTLLKNSSLVTAFLSTSKQDGGLVHISPKTFKRPSANESFALLETAEIKHVITVANGLSSLLVTILTSQLNSKNKDGTSTRSMLLYQDERGRTPLHHAAAQGNKPAAMTMISALLRDAGKEVAMQEWLAIRDVAGYTSAELACIYGHVSFAWFLYNGGGDEGADGKKMNPAFCEKIVDSFAVKKGPKSNDDDEDDEDNDDEKNLVKNVIHSSDPSRIDIVSDAAIIDRGGWESSSFLSLLQQQRSQKEGLAYSALVAVEKNLLHRNNKSDIAVSSPQMDSKLLFQTFNQFSHDCDVQVISAKDLTAKSFYSSSYTINRPLLIRGLALEWKNVRSHFTREALLANINASKYRFFPTISPYGRPFVDVSTRINIGDHEKGGKLANHRLNVTMSEFIQLLEHDDVNNIVRDKDEESKAPVYIYEALKTFVGAGGVEEEGAALFTNIIEGFDLIPSFLRFEISGLDEARIQAVTAADAAAKSKKSKKKTSSLSSSFYQNRTGLVLQRPSPTLQFYLGGPGSGSPFHFHKDAFNALMYGKKRWFLLPPSQALYSTIPVSSWVANTPLDGPKAHTGLKMCTQLEGDVMYVPHGWAHAVMNLETSVGLSVEFSSVLQE
jgi:hypothetical protein